MVMRKKSLFLVGKRDPRLSRVISITSPTAFKRSVRTLKKGAFTRKEQAALILAQNRAKAQLARKKLSDKERRQFTAITKVRIPKVRKG